MAGLVPAIHVFSLLNFQGLDARHINAKTRFWPGELFSISFWRSRKVPTYRLRWMVSTR
jgi:hypothetical protein